jgi:hypothetical protein
MKMKIHHHQTILHYTASCSPANAPLHPGLKGRPVWLPTPKEQSNHFANGHPIPRSIMRRAPATQKMQPTRKS